MLLFSILFLLIAVSFLGLMYIGESKPAPWNTTGFIGALRKQYRDLRFLCWFCLAMLVIMLPFLTSMPW